jgi:subfamily B ATP-binding cassette protein MsbA
VIVFKRLFRLAKPHTAKLILAMFFMLIVGGLTSVLAFLVKPALDDIFVERNARMLQWIPLAVIGIYLVKGACTYAQAIIMNWIGQRIVTDLRNQLYKQIQQQSLSFFTKNPQAS